jgi:hypothetical protein
MARYNLRLIDSAVPASGAAVVIEDDGTIVVSCGKLGYGEEPVLRTMVDSALVCAASAGNLDSFLASNGFTVDEVEAVRTLAKDWTVGFADLLNAAKELT